MRSAVKEIGAATLFEDRREFGKTIEWLLTGKGFRGTQVSGGLKSERQNLNRVTTTVDSCRARKADKDAVALRIESQGDEVFCPFEKRQRRTEPESEHSSPRITFRLKEGSKFMQRLVLGRRERRSRPPANRLFHVAAPTSPRLAKAPTFGTVIPKNGSASSQEARRFPWRIEDEG